MFNPLNPSTFSTKAWKMRIFQAFFLSVRLCQLPVYQKFLAKDSTLYCKVPCKCLYLHYQLNKAPLKGGLRNQKKRKPTSSTNHNESSRTLGKYNTTDAERDTRTLHSLHHLGGKRGLPDRHHQPARRVGDDRGTRNPLPAAGKVEKRRTAPLHLERIRRRTAQKILLPDRRWSRVSRGPDGHLEPIVISRSEFH